MSKPNVAIFPYLHNVKRLLILAFLALFTCRASGQRLIQLSKAGQYSSRYVAFLDSVVDIKVISNSLAYATLGSKQFSHRVDVQLSGKGAAKLARAVKGQQVYTQGIIKILNRKPLLRLRNLKQITIDVKADGPEPCHDDDPTQTVHIDSLSRRH
jgi:hypothetical protein